VGAAPDFDDQLLDEPSEEILIETTEAPVDEELRTPLRWVAHDTTMDEASMAAAESLARLSTSEKERSPSLPTGPGPRTTTPDSRTPTYPPIDDGPIPISETHADELTAMEASEVEPRAEAGAVNATGDPDLLQTKPSGFFRRLFKREKKPKQ
jgi:hypothetical protein